VGVVSAALAALCGAALAGGLLLLAVGIRGTPPRPAKPSRTPRRPVERFRTRLALAIGAGLAMALATKWPVGALLAAGLGWWWPTLYGANAARRVAVARVEAVAAWTEMLRDTMAAAAGLEQAILSTVTVAPEQIRGELAKLAARLQTREPLGDALRAFADDLADPSADRVVVSLILASEQRAQRLGELLGALAAATREEVAMRLRVETQRARTRTSSRLIVVFTLVLAGALVLLDRAYLEPFDSALGQVVLVVVGLAFGSAFWWLHRMARLEAPERFLMAAPPAPATAKVGPR
jgi:Flp pilus assembly protein TadB